MPEMFPYPRGQEKAHWNSHGSLVYVGSSMYPALKAPEIVYFDPYADRKVRPGDVVVFNDPARGVSITHRVILVTPEGIKTRGDNNNRIDPWTLKKEDLAGRVVFARRDRRYRPVRGGLYGLVSSAIIRMIRGTYFTCISPLSVAYRKAFR